MDRITGLLGSTGSLVAKNARVINRGTAPAIHPVDPHDPVILSSFAG
jgi:hypothetical protein